MSTIVRPTGNRPGGVYWRRRLLLLIVVLMLVWGVRHLLAGGDDPGASGPVASGAGASPATTAPTPTASPSNDAGTRTGGGPASRSNRRGPFTVALGKSYGACSTDQVMVRPAVPDGSYAGAAVPVELAMSTTQKMACTLDLADSRLLVAIVSAGDEPTTVWASSTCPTALPTGTVQLDPTWATVVAMTWSGRESGAHCRTDAPLVDAGDYTVKAAMLGGDAAESDFTLTTHPAPGAPQTSKGQKKSKAEKKQHQDANAR